MSFYESQLYIDGALRPAEHGRTYDNINPWTGEAFGRAADASAADVEEAIVAARRAFDTTDWSTDIAKRMMLLERLHALFEANRERLEDIARREVGSGLGAVASSQVGLALSSWRDLMNVVPQVEWEKDYGSKGASHRRSYREAAGVVVAITPWNVPLYVNAEKVVSALIAGCTVVLKPAPDTPFAGAIFGELAKEAGFPAGVLNVVTGADPALQGEILITDPRVDLVTFTGSTRVGKHILQQSSADVKRVFLELGGKSAAIVLDDTPDFADVIAKSIVVYHAGQGCVTLSRLLVSRFRYEEAKAALSAAYAAYEDHWGSYDDPGCTMGPLASKQHLNRVKSYVDIGVSEGATLLAGGKLRPDKGDGWFIEPTCFVDVHNDMRIAQEEIFGPVLAVIPYDDVDDAVRIANDSAFGLSGGVWSGNFNSALAIAKRLRVGTVRVNGGMPINGDLPFGGYKQSGIGRAWGVDGIYEYLQTKVIAWPATYTQSA